MGYTEKEIKEIENNIDLLKGQELDFENRANAARNRRHFLEGLLEYNARFVITSPNKKGAVGQTAHSEEDEMRDPE